MTLSASDVDDVWTGVASLLTRRNVAASDFNLLLLISELETDSQLANVQLRRMSVRHLLHQQHFARERLQRRAALVQTSVRCTTHGFVAEPRHS